MADFKRYYATTSGSFAGNGSGLTNITATSASYAITASYAMNGGGGSTTGSFTGSFTGSLLGTASYALTASYAMNGGGSPTGSFTGSFTGSLLGTSSYSDQALSASYATTASYYGGSVTSASYASTASYVQTAQTASYVTTAQTASYVTTAQTASYVLNAVSASYATTASYVANASSFPYTGSALITGSLGVTGSISTTSNLTATEITASSGNVRVDTFFKGFLLPQYGYIGNGFATGFPGSSDSYMSWDDGSITTNVAGTGKNISLVRSGAQRILLSNTDAKIYINANESGGAISIRQQDTNALTVLYAATDGYYVSIGFPYQSESLASGSLHVRNKSGKNAAIVAEGATTGSTQYTFRAYNSASVDLFSIRDDGYITLSGSIAITGSITGSITSASYASTASYVTTAQTASYVATASWANNAVTASYVTLAQTASYVTTAQTASYITTAQTASYVATASWANNAITASYIDAGSITTGTLNNSRLPSQINITGYTGSFTGSFTGNVNASILSLANTTPTVNGDIGYDQTNKDLVVGDGSVSQKIRLGAPIDFSGTINPTGFASVTVNTAVYWNLGVAKIVYVDISGTSNASTFGFTLPTTPTTSTRWSGLASTSNNANGASPALAVITASSTTGAFHLNYATNTWTALNTKGVKGFFMYF